MKNIFPKEIIEDTVEVHRFKHTVKSKMIYNIILLSVIVLGASLPFIYVDVYSSSRGIIKTEKERNQITSLYSGKIKNLLVKDNEFIKKGDTLVIIDNKKVKEKIHLISDQLDENEKFIYDLNYLLKTKKVNSNSFKTELYQKKHIEYRQKLRELQTRVNKSKSDFVRQQKLYNKGVISKVAFENYKYSLDLAYNELNYFKKQQNNKWQFSLIQEKNKKKELEKSKFYEENDQKNYIIKAPIEGTIQNLKGLEPGNFVTAGSLIAEISPNSELVVECFVSPSDIGLLELGNTVKFQVDAFNYNQWGTATGRIININKDVSLVNKIPMFKVLCSINENGLSLKNGFKGELKKGMTLTSHFVIANRSVYNLLYDKVDDWVNPSKMKK